MSGELLIDIRGLSKRYGGGFLRGKGFPALDGVTLAVDRSSVFGLLGPNGAGKTTLVKVLLGLVGGWSGEARIFGLPAGDAGARRRIGYLPEAHRLPGYLTGRQVLRLFGMMCGRERDFVEARIPDLLERVAMSESADRKMREYSKGMLQRIGLAQAMIHEPDLLILDEPTDGVDPVGRAAIRDVIGELKRRGTTIFINSHLLMEVERMCDRVVIMDKGRILRAGTIEELTPSTGVVHFEIEPVRADLELLLAGLGRQLQPLERGFSLAVADAELDAVVDRLRAAGISIRGLSLHRMNLEESFIDLVGRVTR